MADQTGFVLSEPLFYGMGATVGCTPEDFIARVEDLQQTKNWTDAQAGASAFQFLREEAKQFYTHALPAHDRALATQCRNSFREFRTVFKTTYFNISRPSDVSTDYANLRQEPKEDATTFLWRVAAIMNQYEELLPAQDPLPAILNAFTAVMDAAEPHLNNAQNALLAPALTTALRASQLQGYHYVINAQILKTVAAGLTHPKMKDIVKKAERRQTTLFDIAELLRNATRDLGKATAFPARPPKSSVPTVGKVDEVDNTEDGATPEEVAAFHQMKRNQKKQAGKPKTSNGARPSGSGSAPPKSADPNAAKPPRRPKFDPSVDPCRRCNQKGHWMRDCPALAPAPRQEEVNLQPHKATQSTGTFAINSVFEVSAETIANQYQGKANAGM